MAEEFVMNEEVVEAAAEEIVTTKPKFSWGKFALAGIIIGGVAVGATKLVKFIKSKKAAKKVETENESKNWVEELHKINEEPMADDLAE